MKTNKFDKAINEIESLSVHSKTDNWLNNINPIVKIFVTVLYLLVVVSFEKQNLWGLFSMILYPAILFLAADISLKDALRRLKIILPLIIFMAILNPIFDRQVVGEIFGIKITSGFISMLTLILKGFFTVFATYILILTTSLEKICYSLKAFHFPEILITIILIEIRFIPMLLGETKKVTQAYSLRAPGQKGIHFRVWGSLAGSILVRSVDRANEIYDSMCLRGYSSKFFTNEKMKFRFSDFAFLAVASLLIITFRIYPVFSIIGNLFI